MPIARAGLRFTPRSSRNTALGRRRRRAARTPARRSAGRACGAPRPPTRRRRRTPRCRAARGSVPRVGPRPSCSSARRPAGPSSRSRPIARDHLRARREAAPMPCISSAASTVPPGVGALGLERGAELVEAQLGPLEPGPRAVLGARGDHGADEAVGEPVLALVRVERRRTATGTPRRRGRRSPPGRP